MECENHEYKRPLSIRISDLLSAVIPALLVSIWLPDTTNPFLVFFVAFSVVLAMDKIHFDLIERPLIRDWIIKHMEEHHMEK